MSTPTAGRVGFAGLGAMGLPMAAALRRAGFDVVAWNRSARPEAAAAAEGITLVADPAELGRRACTVLTMLPDLPNVQALADAGLLGAGSVVDTLVVMGTVSPVEVVAFAAAVAPVSVVDAPVSGGTAGAQAATLSIMVGGSGPDVEALAPVFAAMGSTVRHMGPLGAGELTKACNQLVVGATLTALAEAALLGRAGGLDVATLLDVLAGGLAASEVLTQKRGHLVSQAFGGDGAAAYLAKDLRFVRDAASRAGVALPVAGTVSDLFDALTAAGLGDFDNSVVLKWLAGTHAASDQAG